MSCATLPHHHSCVPVIIISFNNSTYTGHMVRQLLDRHMTCRILIVDNCSTHPACVRALDTLVTIHAPLVQLVRMPVNLGHTVYKDLAPLLPPKYVVTDPDLLFPAALPHDAIAQLDALSTKHAAPVIGLALDISKPQDFDPEIRLMGWQSIVDNQAKFWSTRWPDPDFAHPLYVGATDTTFAFRTSAVTGGPMLRVAGSFTVLHMPRYRTPLLHIPDDEAAVYALTQKCSTTCQAKKNKRTVSTTAILHTTPSSSWRRRFVPKTKIRAKKTL
jgi:hypothetical protein